MIWRPWVVSSLLVLAVVFNSVLMYLERLPTPEVRDELNKLYDEPLRKLTYLPGNRRNNLKVMGMTDDLADAAANHAARFAPQTERFRKMLEEHSAEMTDILCPSEKLPQPYSMLAYLVYEDNAVRYVVDPGTMQKLERNSWFDTENIPGLYDAFERVENRRTEASLMAVAAVLLNREDAALEGVSPWYRGRGIGSWGFQRLQNSEPRITALAIEYFGFMHFLTEIANEPQRGICL
jgi:hypothetical protein